MILRKREQDSSGTTYHTYSLFFGQDFVGADEQKRFYITKGTINSIQELQELIPSTFHFDDVSELFSKAFLRASDVVLDSVVNVVGIFIRHV